MEKVCFIQVKLLVKISNLLHRMGNNITFGKNERERGNRKPAIMDKSNKSKWMTENGVGIFYAYPSDSFLNAHQAKRTPRRMMLAFFLRWCEMWIISTSISSTSNHNKIMNPQRGHYHFMKIAEGYNETAKESKRNSKFRENTNGFFSFETNMTSLHNYFIYTVS